MTDPSIFVLDSYALLAYLQDEPVAPRVEKLLEDAGKGKCRLLFSMINLGELLYITETRDMPQIGTVYPLPCEVCIPPVALFTSKFQHLIK
jgi:hypothetical protein